MAREWYILLWSRSDQGLDNLLKELEGNVNKRIEQGYVPQGGIAVVPIAWDGPVRRMHTNSVQTDAYFVSQAMVWKKLPHEVSQE